MNSGKIWKAKQIRAIGDSHFCMPLRCGKAKSAKIEFLKSIKQIYWDGN